MHPNSKLVVLLALLQCASAFGQVHRPPSTRLEIEQGMNVGSLPAVNLADSVELMSKIDPKSPEGRRAARYDPSNQPPLYKQSGTFRITTVYRPADPLPVTASALVVTGTITSASAHLTKSGAAIYTTFSFSPDKIIKNNGTAAVPSSIILERNGGVALYPNGRKELIGPVGFGLPEVHHRYLLFLAAQPDTDSYSIITGYLIDGPKVISLDKLGDNLNDLDSSALITRTIALQSR